MRFNHVIVLTATCIGLAILPVTDAAPMKFFTISPAQTPPAPAQQQPSLSSSGLMDVFDKLDEYLINPNTIYGHKLNKIRAAQGITDTKYIHEEYIITPEETEAYQLALKTEDEIYKSPTLTGKFSEEHFQENLLKFLPYLEKVALRAGSPYRLIKASVSDFTAHCGKYYIFAEKSEKARETCGKPSVMAAAAVLMGALDADGKTLNNMDLKKPLVEKLVKRIGSEKAILERCAWLISDVYTNVKKEEFTNKKEDLTKKKRKI